MNSRDILKILKGNSPRIIKSNIHRLNVLPIEETKILGEGMTLSNNFKKNHLAISVKGATDIKEAIRISVGKVPELFRRGRFETIFVQIG